MEPKTLITVFLALIFLTFITVYVTRFELGPLNIVAALGIATAKAILVMFWFMHLKYDRPFNVMIFLCSFGFVILFIGFLLMDTAQYQPSVEARQQALKPASPMPPAAPMIVPTGINPDAPPAPATDAPAGQPAASTPAPASTPNVEASTPK
jgi:cytochrome c oxidase subunit 4